MRLPTRGTYEDIDEQEAIRMIRHAIDHGVDYVDTAYGYHGGNSEIVLGKALAEGYRQRVKIATKLPPWHVKAASDFDRLLNEQLRKLKVEHIDRYLIHSLGRKNWESMSALGILDWAERKLREGRIGLLGFSFHDDVTAFKQIVDAYDRWAFCQIQYNYLNETVQAGTEGLRYAAEKGLAVVVMEPLLGGNLVNPPAAIQRLWDTASARRSAAEWALQWLWNKPEVSVVLSGMSTMQQLAENLASAERSGVGALSRADIELVSHVAATYEKLRPIPCTQCNYCLPCPNGVSIPHNLALYNNAVMYNQKEQQRGRYAATKEEERASACTECLECEEKCPQKITISEWMACIDQELGLRARA